jgi:uncharacterized protein
MDQLSMLLAAAHAAIGDLSPTTIAAAAVAVLFAYTMLGLTGFGASIVGMPLLVQVLPLRVALPMMLVFDLVSMSALGLRNRASLVRAEFVRLLPFMLAGMALGLTLLVHAPERVLLLVLGVFVLANAAWTLLFRISATPVSTRWAAPLGVAGGVFGAMFGTGGPIYTIYLARRIADKVALRATIVTVLVVSAFTRFALFVGAGLLAHRELLALVPLLFPCMLLGLYAGSRLHQRLPAHRVIQVVWTILVIAGISLIWRGAFGR